MLVLTDESKMGWKFSSEFYSYAVGESGVN